MNCALKEFISPLLRHSCMNLLPLMLSAFCYSHTCSFHMLLKIQSVIYSSKMILINFDLKKLPIITSYDKWASYLDIYRPVSALYKMVLARVALNLITQRSLKKFFSIIFTDNKSSSIVSYESWHAFLST